MLIVADDIDDLQNLLQEIGHVSNEYGLKIIFRNQIYGHTQETADWFQYIS